MEKMELIKELKNNIHDINSLRANLYHGKVFAIVGYNGLQATFKTKRGAEGYIKRKSNISYYDEMTFEMVNAGSGLQVIELLEDEIPVINIQMVYNIICTSMYDIHNYKHGALIISALETAQADENILLMAKSLIEEIESTGAMTKPLELYTAEELADCIEYMTNNYTPDYKERLKQAKAQLEHMQTEKNNIDKPAEQPAQEQEEPGAPGASGRT